MNKACLNKCLPFLKIYFLSTGVLSFPLFKKWKNAVGKGKILGAPVSDLSKAFDCLNNELLIAKLNVYGITLPDLKLIHNYLPNRK